MNNTMIPRRNFFQGLAFLYGLGLVPTAGTLAKSLGATEDDPFAGLEPHALWTHFAAFTRTPRQSGNEGPIAKYVLDWATARRLQGQKDSAGNVIVRVPATPGREKAPVVLIQGHLDQVASRDESAGPFDPAKGNIRVFRAEKRGEAFVEAKDGAYLKAYKTTLGADCGVACSAMMALGEDRTREHGPLELLFTVDEETGLNGAKNLDVTLISSKIYLNVDSEEDGVLTIGSCGGRNTVITFSRPRSPLAEGEVAVKLAITNLSGGHSGVDINKGRPNAIKVMGHLLQETEKHVSFRLAAINGGDASNAIPREADAVVIVSAGDEAAFRQSVEKTRIDLRTQYKKVESNMKLNLDRDTSSRSNALSLADSRSLIDLLQAIPSGVLAMSQKVDGLVETSNNLGVIRTVDGTFKITCSSRSSVDAALEQTTDTLVSIAELVNATAEPSPSYPGWDPNPDSAVVNAVTRTYRRLHGASPKLQAIHAGLECGVIASKIPGLDTVSFGPTVEGAHSNQESVNIASVSKFYNLLAEVLADLSAN